MPEQIPKAFASAIVDRIKVSGSARTRFLGGPMKVRFYIDPETNLPHLYKHGVDEGEVEDVLRRPGEDRPGREGSRVAIGQTRAGRYLRVIYVPDPEPESVFVIQHTN